MVCFNAGASGSENAVLVPHQAKVDHQPHLLCSGGNFLLSLYRQNQRERTGWVLPGEFDVRQLSWTRRQLAAVGGRQLPPGVIDSLARDDAHFDRLDRLVVWCCLSGCQEDCRPLMPDGSCQPRHSTEWRYVETTAGRVCRFRVDARQEVGGVGVLDAAGSFLITTIALDLRVDELVRLLRWHLVRVLPAAEVQPAYRWPSARFVVFACTSRARPARWRLWTCACCSACVVSDAPGLAVRAAVPPAPPAVRRVVLGGGGAGAESVEAGESVAAVKVPVHSSRMPVLRLEPRRPAGRRDTSPPQLTGQNRESRGPSPGLPTFHEMLAAARAEAEASAEAATVSGQFDDAEAEADREVHQLMEQRFSPIRDDGSDVPRQAGRPVGVVRPRFRHVRHRVTHGRGRGIRWPPSR